MKKNVALDRKKDVVLYGAGWCPHCRRVKSLLDAVGIEYTYKDVDVAAYEQEMLEITEGAYLIPTLRVGSSFEQNPSNSEVLQMTGQDESKNPKVYDVVMVGAGPTALAAAIYTTREDLSTVLIEKGVIGGLAATTDWVDNYPGFEKGVAGLDLSEGMRKQAERFGAIIELDEVLEIIDEGQQKRLKTATGEYLAKSVLLATGSDFKKLGIPGEDVFYGRGVHYCATCDGAFYREKRLVVVGGGNSAVQEAMFLTRFATHIDLLVRGAQMRASEVLIHELETKHKDKITVHYNTLPQEIVGVDNKVTKVVVKDATSGNESAIETDGVFVFIGLKPNTLFLKSSDIKLDELGFIITDDKLQTGMNGVFAAGDVRSGATMQIASATGEGATAALMIRKFLES